MRKKIRKDSIPRWAKDIFPGVEVVAFDVFWKKGARVKACFFKTRRDLRYAWRRLSELRGDHGVVAMGQASGFVHQCWQERWNAKDGSNMVVDRKYAAVICLLAPKLTIEVCAHEAVHAGLALLRRKTGRPDASVAEMEDEEELAYPTGFITASLINCAKREGFLSTQ